LHRNTFAVDLWRKSDRGLSQGPSRWVHVLVNEALNLSLSSKCRQSRGIRQLWNCLCERQASCSGLQSGCQRQLWKCQGFRGTGASHWRMLQTVVRLVQTNWYGRIDAMGQWVPSRASNSNVDKLLGLLAQDPVGTMQAYGHSTGQCGFCGRTLMILALLL